MELAAGTKLGPYEIQRKLGAGGMGVVYRALDSRLGRAVAIKVLPASMKHEPERLKRFEREARTVGGLNHPNLVTLFDVGSYEETPFLVTELLDGYSLRDKMRDGKLASREAVRIAGEIARGLAAAHGAGITHRDIKPENIFVMADDRVKVLDFGIAKLTDNDDAGSASTLAGVGPDGGTAHTGTGIVVGTPGYMAPEQLGGGAVGPRTDIFALGVVLHEMLAGRRPFANPTNDGTAPGIEESYAILKQVPTELPTNVPPAIARVVRRCLEKRPEARFQSASDLAFALGDVGGTDSASDQRAQRVSEDAIAATVAQPAITGDGVVKTLPGIAIVAPPTPAPHPTSPQPAATTAQLVMPGSRQLGPWILGSVLLVVLGGVAIVWFLRGAPRAPAATAAAATRVDGRWPEVVPGGVEYKRVTFLPQPATFARFTNDEAGVVWSLRRSDQVWHVMTSGISMPSMTDLALSGRLLDVAPDGELALRNKGEGEGGTLQVGRSGMGAPRFVAVHVEEAAWGTDKTFAILRAVPDAGIVLEYPIGKVLLHPKTGGLAMLHVSRDGNFVAVVETEAPPQTSGHVAIVDTAGKVISTSKDYTKIDGVAWTYQHEVWFSEGTTLHALTRDGRERVLFRSVLPIGIKDVAKDGRILAAPRQVRARTLVGVPNGEMKNVGWFDGSEVTSISKDGGTITFIESTGKRDANGFEAFRRTASEAPVSIGSAFTVALLPDASAAIAVTGERTPIRVIPSDARASTDLPLGAIDKFDLADRPAISWSGKYLVVRAAAAGKRMRLWRYDLGDPAAAPTPVGPDTAVEGSHPISSDGKWIAMVDRGKGIVLVSTAGEPSQHVATDAKLAANNKDESTAIGFSEDDAALYTMALHEYPREIDRIDRATGQKTPIVTIAPEDKPQLMSVVVDGNAGAIAYSLIIETSEVYVIQPPVGATSPP